MNIITAAQKALDQWEPDNASDAEIVEVFRAIFGRVPDEDDDPVSDIYAARDALNAAEAKRLVRVLQ